MAQAGCGVDSPIVPQNLKGEKKDRRAGSVMERWKQRMRKKKKAVEAVKYRTQTDGLGRGSIFL